MHEFTKPQFYGGSRGFRYSTPFIILWMMNRADRA